MIILILLLIVAFLGGVIFMLYWFLKSMLNKPKDYDNGNSEIID